MYCLQIDIVTSTYRNSARLVILVIQIALHFLIIFQHDLSSLLTLKIVKVFRDLGSRPFRFKDNRHPHCNPAMCPMAMKRPAAPLQVAPEGQTWLTTMQLAKEALNRENVERFYSLLNNREAIRTGRAAGLHGRHLYDTLTGEFADYLRCCRCTNVHRSHDATTRGLHALCASQRRLQLSSNESLLKRQIVMNFAVWRLIGGTTAFASEVGFLTNWGEEEKRLIRGIIQRAFEQKRIPTLLANAYAWPRKMRVALANPRANADTLNRVLYNEGEKVLQGFAVTDLTLVGKFEVLDKLWNVCGQVVEAAKADEYGRTSMERVGEVLKFVPFFGQSTKSGERKAGFFAKELIQDLVDTVVFPGGRNSVMDHSSFCPVGPGSIRGLELVFGRSFIHPSETLPMMQALQSFAIDYFAGDAKELELHDIQFQLCEFQKKFFSWAHRPYSAIPDDLGGPMLHWTPDFILQRLREMLVFKNYRLGALKEDQGSLLRFAKELCTWLGVSFCHGSRDSNARNALLHGDLVVIQEVGSNRFFSLKHNGALMLVPDEAVAAKFLVTTDEIQIGAISAIRFGSPIHLETTRCKQLAWWNRNQCFAARVGGKRFDEEHLLTLEPVEFIDTASQISQAKDVERSKRTSAEVATVLLGEPVKLRAFDRNDRSQNVCLRRPKEVVAREQHMLELIQTAVMEWNTKHPPKRRRIGDATGTGQQRPIWSRSCTYQTFDKPLLIWIMNWIAWINAFDDVWCLSTVDSIWDLSNPSWEGGVWFSKRDSGPGKCVRTGWVHRWGDFPHVWVFRLLHCMLTILGKVKLVSPIHSAFSDVATWKYMEPKHPYFEL